jgi:ATP-dependent DNA ligase
VDNSLGEYRAECEIRNTARCIIISPFEQGEIGPHLFRAACGMGLEGLVSKRRDRPYQGGRSKYWLKVKNRRHPAMSRLDAVMGPARSERLMWLSPDR